MAKFRIKKIPTGSIGVGGNTNTRSTQYTGNMIYPLYKPNMMAEPPLQERTTLSAVPRDMANLEAEKNETALIPDVGGLAAHYKIGGKRHSKGGTPLSLPDDSFIFSDTSKMKIGGDMLKYFGKNSESKKKYTPADLAKQYDINTYRKTLADPTIDDPIHVRTAEKMIGNYNLKLAKLALIQESKKGFPQGIPAVALPYLATNMIDPSQILPLKGGEEQGEQFPDQEQGELQARYGMQYSKLMNDGGPLHAGPQDWANFGNALMQEGGSKRFDIDKIKRQIQKAENDWEIQIQKASNDQMAALLSNQRDRELASMYSKMNKIQEQADKENLYSRFNFLPSFLEPTTAETEIKDLEEISKRYNIPLSDPQVQTAPLKALPMPIDSSAVVSKYMKSHPQTPAVSNVITYDQLNKLSSEEQDSILSTLPDSTKQRLYNSIPEKRYGGLIKAQDGLTLKQKLEKNLKSKSTVKPVSNISQKKSGPSVVETPEQTADRTAHYNESYKLLEHTFTNPANESLREELYKRWKDNINTLKPSKDPKKGMSQSDIDKMKSYSKDDVINNLMKAQKQIFTIQQSYPQEKLKDKTWDKGRGKNETYQEAAKKLGIPPMSEDEIGTFQTAYRVLQDLSDEPEYSPLLNQFNLVPIGEKDQTYGKGSKPISPVDAWFGNTTVGQALLAKPGSPRVGTYGEPDTKPTSKLDTSYTPEVYNKPADAPWWAQDVIKTAGAAGDFMRIKKYLPWSPVVAPYVPDPTFYDPTRELAANAEQANIQTQGASTFGNPQQFGAVAASIQGNAAKNVADVLGKYNNLNVGVVNQFSGIRGDIMNRANEANAANATSLYDKTTMANQNFDNAKNMARQELRSSYIDAITNRANAQVMNTLYPNYQIDPSTGGMMNFYKGSKFDPRNPQDRFDQQSAFFDKVKIKDSTATWASVFGHSNSNTDSEEDYRPPGYNRRQD